MIDEDKLHSIYIPHLRSQVRSANLILFTGAGFSRGATNQLGEATPDAKALKEVYWKMLYGSEPPDGEYTLADIYDDLKIKNPKALREETYKRLSLRPNSLADWYENYFRIPWIAAYTLNIDDLAEVANRQFNLARPWKSISATSRFSTSLTLTGPRSLDLVHLNGTLQDLPDKVTFSSTQYAERASGTDPWSLKVANDLLSHSIVFVGTDLNEPPLWRFMALRGNRGGRELGELRPRSYLVTPGLSKPREALLSQFNIVHIPLTAQLFSEKVLGKIDDVDVAMGKEILSSHYATGKTASLPLDLSKVDISPREKTDFLMGQDPVWSDITSGRAIERDFDAEFEGEVRRQIAKKQPKPIVITGPAGSGKTTTLMRVALKLSAEGKKVFWIDRNTEINPAKVVEFALSGNVGVIAIDDSDVYGPQLSILLNEICQRTESPVIICEMRSHYIDRCLVAGQLGSTTPVELVIPKLTDGDIEKLIAVLDDENRLGNLKAESRQNQIAAFREKADRELVVAMYEATTGLSFRQRIVDELSQLDDLAKRIYALVAVAGSRRFALSREEIVHATGEATNATANEIERLTKRRLLVHPRSDTTTFTCRHRIIGNFVRDAVHQQGLMYPIILGLLRQAALKTTSHMSGSAKPKRILRVFINHDFVYEMLDLNQARTLYAELEPLLNSNHHFCLHRGSLEVEWGNIEYAENFLAQALSLAPNDSLVKNEWAYLLFKKAVRTSGSLDAPEWARDAQDILVELIYEDKSHPHPYHVLGSQGLSWSKVGIREIDKRVEYLRWLEKHIKRGIEEFPGNALIREIAQRIQTEMLSLAVSKH